MKEGLVSAYARSSLQWRNAKCAMCMHGKKAMAKRSNFPQSSHINATFDSGNEKKAQSLSPKQIFMQLKHRTASIQIPIFVCTTIVALLIKTKLRYTVGTHWCYNCFIYINKGGVVHILQLLLTCFSLIFPVRFFWTKNRKIYHNSTNNLNSRILNKYSLLASQRYADNHY